jgi:hypothetical protein
MLKVIQRFGRHFSCYLQGYMLVDIFLELVGEWGVPDLTGAGS